MAEYPGTSSQQDTPPASESRNWEDVTPTLRDLSLLSVPNWYLLGLQLGISGDELDMIEKNYPRDNDLCKVKTFAAWLRVDTSASYSKLARALVTVGKRNIAEAMCTARGIPLTVLDDVPGTTVDYVPPLPRRRTGLQPSSSTHRMGSHPNISTRSSSFPYLNTSGLTPEQQERLKIRLCVESEDIVDKFWSLHSGVYKSLCERNIPVNKLVTHLLSLHAFDPVYKGSQKPVLQTFFQELRSARSIEDVLFIIRDYLSFFNYRVIKHIVDGLGTEQDRAKLQNYEKEFNEYSKRRVYECPPQYGSKSSADHVDLVLKVDSVYEDFTVKELKKFECRLSRIFCVTPQSVLRLCQVEEGCLQLIFQVPLFVQQEIFPLSSEQESALTAEGVIRLTCGDYHFGAKGDEKSKPKTYWVGWADEEIVDLVQKLGDANRYLVLVTTGRIGVGKSTLINNLLGLKGEKAAIAKRSARSVTKTVDYYEEEVHGITMRIIDTPGLEATDVISKQELEAFKEVSELTDGKVDVLLHCVSLASKLDSHIVQKLTKAFGGEIWRRAILVFTHGDSMLTDDEEENRELLEELTTEFEEIMKKAGVCDVPVRSILSTQDVSVNLESEVAKPKICGIPVGKQIKIPPDWALMLFKEIIKKCKITKEMCADAEAIQPDQPATTDADQLARTDQVEGQIQRPLVLVTAGKAGVGKSTLINNFLGLKGEKAAKAEHSADSGTKSVDYYEEEINGISVRIIDTPGLEASDLTKREQKVQMATVSQLVDGKADLLLYCMCLVGRFDDKNHRIVKNLTETFGKEIWRHTILVLTFGDVTLKGDEEKDRRLLEGFTGKFEEALQKAGVSDVSVKYMLSTQDINIPPDLESAKPEVVGIPVGDCTEKPADWALMLFTEVIKKCRIDAIPALLVLRGITPELIGKLVKRVESVDKARQIVGGLTFLGLVVGGGGAACVGGAVTGLGAAGLGLAGATFWNFNCTPEVEVRSQTASRGSTPAPGSGLWVTAMTATVSAAVTRIGGIVSAAVTRIGRIVDPAVTGIGGIVGPAVTGTGRIVDPAVTGIGRIVDPAVTRIRVVTDAITRLLGSAVSHTKLNEIIELTVLAMIIEARLKEEARVEEPQKEETKEETRVEEPQTEETKVEELELKKRN